MSGEHLTYCFENYLNLLCRHSGDELITEVILMLFANINRYVSATFQTNFSSLNNLPSFGNRDRAFFKFPIL